MARLVCSGLSARQNPAHHGGQTAPFAGFGGEPALAAACDRIELRPAPGVGLAPFRRNEAAVLEPDERRVDGALVQDDGVAALLLDAPRDATAVLAEPAHHHAPTTLELAERPRGEARASVPPRVAGRVRALSERQHQAGPSVGGKSPNAGGTSLGAPPHRGAAAAPHRERAAGRGSGSAAPISTPA